MSAYEVFVPPTSQHLTDFEILEQPFNLSEVLISQYL
jgi:hypothetical protein